MSSASTLSGFSAPLITPFGAFQTALVNQTTSEQSLIQFNPGPASTPSNTWTYFFVHLKGLTQLCRWLVTNRVYPADNYTTLQVLSEINNQVREKFYTTPSWSSSIQNSPGWASDNSVNAYNTQLNTVLLENSFPIGTKLSDFQRYAYFIMYAIKVEANEVTLQTNQYLYNFIVSTEVTTTDFTSSTTVTRTVSEWFDALVTYWHTVLIAHDPEFFNSPSSLYPSIISIIDQNTSSALDLVDRIFPIFKICPITSSSGNNNTVTTYTQSFWLVMLVLLLGYAFNILTIQSAGFYKWSIAEADGIYIFEEASQYIKQALVYVQQVNNQLSDYVVSDDVTVNPLSSVTYWDTLAATSVSARNGQVDGNRIPGVIIPNLTLILQRLQSLQYVATEVQTFYSVYTSDFQGVVNEIADSLGPIQEAINNIQLAIASFDSQLDIHYARWQAYLTVN